MHGYLVKEGPVWYKDVYTGSLKASVGNKWICNSSAEKNRTRQGLRQ